MNKELLKEYPVIVELLKNYSDDQKEEILKIMNEYCPYCWEQKKPCFCYRDD